MARDAGLPVTLSQALLRAGELSETIDDALELRTPTTRAVLVVVADEDAEALAEVLDWVWAKLGENEDRWPE